jgi:hypothetical protein
VVTGTILAGKHTTSTVPVSSESLGWGQPPTYCPSSQLERGEGGVHWVVDRDPGSPNKQHCPSSSNWPCNHMHSACHLQPSLRITCAPCVQQAVNMTYQLSHEAQSPLSRPTRCSTCTRCRVAQGCQQHTRVHRACVHSECTLMVCTHVFRVYTCVDTRDACIQQPQGLLRARMCTRCSTVL